ncbi:hypothetical protein [Streptomyces sp. HUAS ZL42]|uniref:hypothetical protein n=1 Tax=Streptomyces sp. HUAS ZL42 TaxID=3231715 RepID=UPI00345E8158
MLREDASAPRKQKHTTRRIHQRLAQEYDFDLVSYSTVCDYVLARRAQIEAEMLKLTAKLRAAGLGAIADLGSSASTTAAPTPTRR